MIISPIPIKDYRLPGAKLEVACPKCGWAWFAFARGGCAERLDAHRLDMNVPKPEPCRSPHPYCSDLGVARGRLDTVTGRQLFDGLNRGHEVRIGISFGDFGFERQFAELDHRIQGSERAF